MQTDLHGLDRRVLLLESRVEACGERISAAEKRLLDQGVTLAKISKTLDRLLWLAIGASLFYSATTLGIIETLKQVVL